MKDFQLCVDRYEFLIEEFAKLGFSEPLELLKMGKENVEEKNNGSYLKPKAYFPTGLALGCPIISTLAQGCIQKITNRLLEVEKKYNSIHFAMVPFGALHITILNYSHYSSNKKVRPLPSYLLEVIKDILSKLGIASITIEFNKVIVTSSGAVIIAGYPIGDSFFIIRNEIRNELDAFNGQKPNTVHIKIGQYFISSFPEVQLKSLSNDIKQLQLVVNFRVNFKKIFTPTKLITLNEL